MRAAIWQPAHAQAIVGSIPEEFRGDWCQQNTKDNIFKPGGCKLKAGSLSIDRMTELIINLKAAKAAYVHISPTL